jgi:acyl carrier protein
VLFSSAAAMLGSTGQSAHAAANAWLDALSWYRSGLGLPACTVNWGAWSRIGQAARLGQAQDFRRQGIGMILPEEGLAILGATMSAKAIQRGAIPLDLPVFLGTRPRWGLFDDLKVDLDVPGQRLHQSVDQAVDLPAILQELGAVLGRREAANIDPDRDFAALGLDSLATLDLRNRLQRRSGLILSPAAMFEYSTARLLAGHLAMLSSTALGTEDLDSTLSAERAMVDSLSESELDALLSELLTEEDAII